MKKKLHKIIGIAVVLGVTKAEFSSAYTSLYVPCEAINAEGIKYEIGCLVYPESETDVWIEPSQMTTNYANCADVFEGPQNPGWTHFEYFQPTNPNVVSGYHPVATGLPSYPLKANPGYDFWPSNSPCINIDGTTPSNSTSSRDQHAPKSQLPEPRGEK